MTFVIWKETFQREPKINFWIDYVGLESIMLHLVRKQRMFSWAASDWQIFFGLYFWFGLLLGLKLKGEENEIFPPSLSEIKSEVHPCIAKPEPDGAATRGQQGLLVHTWASPATWSALHSLASQTQGNYLRGYTTVSPSPSCVCLEPRGLHLGWGF